ncbi:hypothetical protein ATCC90586_011170 [Pythium insidiosum]|nr:hypothetical protein ATCC90586_011170 [Pythium insidiosum]
MRPPASATASVSPLAARVWVPTAGSAAKKTPVLGARARIQRLAFSSDGRLLLASNQLRAVALWSLHPLVSPSSHSSDCFTSDISKHKPDSLELIDELSPAEVFREIPCPPTVLTRDTPSFQAKAQSRPPISITSTEFVPTLSLFPANRPSVLCAASNGDMMRVWPHGNVVKEKNDLSAASAAAFDVPAPGDTALSALTRPAAREMWRVHQVAVLFVGLLRCAASLESPSLRFVTVDQDGFVARWRHDGAQFSGFGWFTPTEICRLDLSVSPTDSAKGEMLQIALSPTRNRLIVMVYFGSSSAPSAPRGRLRFVQLDVHSDNEMTVVPVRVERDLVGSIAPRFALISVAHRRVYGRSSATTGSTPREAKYCHVLVLLMDNSLYFVSLETGVDCRAVLPLGTASESTMKSRDRGASVLFNAVTAMNASERWSTVVPDGTIASIVVSGEQHRQLRLLRLRVSRSVK